MKSRFQILWILAVALTDQPLVAGAALTTIDLRNANNAFALDLYARLAKEPGNRVVSPLSVDVALTMTCAGARGEF